MFAISPSFINVQVEDSVDCIQKDSAGLEIEQEEQPFWALDAKERNFVIFSHHLRSTAGHRPQRMRECNEFPMKNKNLMAFWKPWNTVDNSLYNN